MIEFDENGVSVEKKVLLPEGVEAHVVATREPDLGACDDNPLCALAEFINEHRSNNSSQRWELFNGHCRHCGAKKLEVYVYPQIKRS